MYTFIHIYTGNAVVKFFWYWLFQGLFNLTFVYFGQFYAYFVPNEALAQGKYICSYMIYVYIYVSMYSCKDVSISTLIYICMYMHIYMNIFHIVTITMN
jgi:hypothetical protein